MLLERKVTFMLKTWLFSVNILPFTKSLIHIVFSVWNTIKIQQKYNKTHYLDGLHEQAQI